MTGRLMRPTMMAAPLDANAAMSASSSAAAWGRVAMAFLQRERGGAVGGRSKWLCGCSNESNSLGAATQTR